MEFNTRVRPLGTCTLHVSVIEQHSWVDVFPGLTVIKKQWACWWWSGVS